MVTERKDPWTLVSAKQYGEAAEEYFRRYKEGGGTFELRGHAKALLFANRPAEALPRFRQVIEETDPTERGDCDFIDVGTCHWYLHQAEQAIAAWRESRTAVYTDAAGGVVPPTVLLYASARLGDSELEEEALRLLHNHLNKHKRRVRRRQVRNAPKTHEDFVHPGLYAWPGSLVPFLLGEIGDADLDQAANHSPSDILRARWQCQADFAAAVRALREGNRAKFRDRMTRSASSQHGELEHEFCLARWEVGNDFPTQPFARTH